MTQQTFETPLLHPDSPLDDHSKALIKQIYLKEQAKALNLPTDDPLDPKRRARVEFTWTEMQEQPEVLQCNLTSEIESINAAAAYIANKNIKRIYMTGCGDSTASMLAVRAFYEQVMGIQCEVVQALDFTYYYHRPVDENTLVITLSSSGNTVRTVEAMLIARAYGAVTLCLSNTPGSPLMVESTHSILIHAKRRGWPTQSSTAAMIILYQLGLSIAKKMGKDSAELLTYQKSLMKVPDLVRMVLDQHNDLMLEISQTEAKKKIFLFAGGGPAFASSLIGAAKIKECTPDHAIAIPLEEYHHYNSQKEGDPIFLTVPDGPSIPRALDTAHEGRRWNGIIYSIISENNHHFNGIAHKTIVLPFIEEYLSPLVYTVPLQQFAYHVAMEKFRLAEMAW